MTSWLSFMLGFAAFVWSSVLADSARPYHSSNPKFIATKLRLLGGDDPNDPSDKPGIRFRMPTQTANIAAVQDHLAVVKTASQSMQAAENTFTPLYESVVQMYQTVSKQFNALDNSIETEKKTLDGNIVNFATQWESDMMKKLQSNPDTYNPVFSKYNSAVLTEYHQLFAQLKQVSQALSVLGNKTYSESMGQMRTQNKTLAGIAWDMQTSAFQFNQMLQRRVLPSMVSTKFRGASDLINLKSAAQSALAKLTGEVIPGITSEAGAYLTQSGNALQSQGQAIMAAGTKQFQRALTLMRGKLNTAAQKQSNSVNKNFTDVSNVLSAAPQAIDKNWQSSYAALQKQSTQTTQRIAQVQSSVLDTTGDMSKMLSDAHDLVAGISKTSALGAEQLTSQAQAKLSQLVSGLSNLPLNTQGVNALQSQISAVYTGATGDVGTKLTSRMQQMIARAQSSASSTSADLSSQVNAVTSRTNQQVSTELPTQVGVANANFKASQSNLVDQVSSHSQDIMAQIDDAQAESDADRASVVSKFLGGINTQSTVDSAMSSQQAKIAQQSSQIQSRVFGVNGGVLSGVSSASSALGSASAQLGQTQSTLGSMANKILPQLDADSEARIQAAFSQLNGLRRQSTSSGDAFQQDSQRMIAQLLAANGVAPTWNVSANGLVAQVSGLKNTSLAYKSQLDAYQAAMDLQMQGVNDAFANASNAAGAGDSQTRELGQIVAHVQAQYADQVRGLVRSIYAQGGSANLSAVDAGTLLGSGLNQSRFTGTFGVMQSQLGSLNKNRASVGGAISDFVNYVGKLKVAVNQRLALDVNDANNLTYVLQLRDAAIAEIEQQESALNATIFADFKTANESIANKSYNFYKEFQTAALVADSLVGGFSDYIAKMIDLENTTAAQREATQETLLKSIRQNMDGVHLNTTNATQIAAVNALVAAAMSSSDQSAEGIAKRQAAQQALIDQFGVSTADKLMQQYSALAGNANALSVQIEATHNASVSDRVAGMQGSQMGLDGIAGKASIFADQAGSVLSAQEQNAAAISAKIDQLMAGGSFLTNISASQLGAILKSVQDSNSVYSNQVNQNQDSTNSQIASLGQVLQDFTFLVGTQVNRTTDFINALSANLTQVVEQSNVIVNDPVNAVMAELRSTMDRADTVNTTLSQSLLSEAPIQEGLQERLTSLSEQQDAFASGIQTQLNEFVSTIRQQDADIAVSRDAGMRKLTTALGSLINGFRDNALEYQSEAVDSLSQTSLLQLKSDTELEQDMSSRIKVVNKLLQTVNHA